MKMPSLRIRLVVACAAGLCLTGCFGFLKPSGVTARYFVLTPLPARPASATPLATTVGVGFVKMPAYLFSNSMAIRQGTNEINYVESTLWAERLDNGMQRVIAANLATLLPTDRVRLSTWRPQDVSAEVYVTVEQFDVDVHGRGVLIAWWRVLSPGGDKVLRAGQFHATREGPAPTADPQGATASMSELAADLSRELAQAIKQVAR